MTNAVSISDNDVVLDGEAEQVPVEDIYDEVEPYVTVQFCCVVATGNPSDGFTHVGPFFGDTWYEARRNASDWADKHDKPTDPWWIIDVESPTDG